MFTACICAYCVWCSLVSLQGGGGGDILCVLFASLVDGYFTDTIPICAFSVTYSASSSPHLSCTPAEWKSLITLAFLLLLNNRKSCKFPVCSFLMNQTFVGKKKSHFSWIDFLQSHAMNFTSFEYAISVLRWLFITYMLK